MRRLLRIVMFLVLLLNLLGCTRNEGFSAQEEITDGQTKGEQVVQALEKYHVDKGRYPEYLQDLIPNYLEEVPMTLAKKEFKYEGSQSDTFYLSFPVTKKKDVGSGTICTYIKRLEGWDCSQSFEKE
ncbi:hypothetical protein ATHL_01190 [Anaerolinea thermolimosa]|uniref:hypothetical protein n=1 Tax=Anaerolinea thermolimosa TaxID=229919 RepID=UPI0007865F8E|nr:hypothetical protein [Anaerolinea thermolimosa]GAP06336.1 hypothetical protein ATHL_01190 [Anaerolinea thermolimosa]